MKAFFFGSSKRQLFGVYHPPRPAVARDEGVLLCYPGAQEYNAAHWAFRKLAGMLAREGFHTLRFDWFGTGDSAGRAEDGHPDVWAEDIETAANELRDSSAVTSISVIGMRLGAAIAALSTAKGRIDPRELILWEPVVSGTKYVSELEAQDRRENFQLLHGMKKQTSTAMTSELVGYPFPTTLKKSLFALDLRELTLPSSVRTSIFSAVDRPDYRKLRDALGKNGGGAHDVTLHHVPEDSGVTNAGVRESALLSNKILVVMTESLARKGKEPRAEVSPS